MMHTIDMTVTEQTERELAEHLRTHLMSVDERDHLRDVLDAVRKARAEGGRIVHVTTGETRISLRLA